MKKPSIIITLMCTLLPLSQVFGYELEGLSELPFRKAVTHISLCAELAEKSGYEKDAERISAVVQKIIAARACSSEKFPNEKLREFSICMVASIKFIKNWDELSAHCDNSYFKITQKESKEYEANCLYEYEQFTEGRPVRLNGRMPWSRWWGMRSH